MKFGIKSLKKSEDLITFFNENMQKVLKIRSSLSSSPPSIQTLYEIDEISNLCSLTADTSQAISELFPNESWKNISLQIQDQMIDIFSDLNHDKLIPTYLESLKTSEKWSNFSNTQKYFTNSILRDLKKEGLGNESSHKTIQRLKAQFIQNIRESRSEVSVNLNEIESIPTQVRPERTGDRFEDISKFFFTKPEIITTLNYCQSGSLRLKLFSALSNTASGNFEVLDKLISTRHSVSASLGYQNYSHFTLAHQSFKALPDRLMSTLHKCSSYLTPKLLNEYSVLLDQKALTEQVSRLNPVSLHPSDIPFYIQKYLKNSLVQKFPNFSSHHSVTNYFTVFNILEGVKSLLLTQFQIKAEFGICPVEETWSNDIVKLSLFKDGLIGVIYLDLFQRPNKINAPAAKFNIICARKKSDFFEQQIPVVVLSTNFQKSSSQSLYLTLSDLKEQGITYSMLQEFYHELGHALHSICSQSEFQIYSGTRVPVDLAEIPSHIFEHFISDYSFVRTWAVHKSTGSEINESFFSYILGEKNEFPAFNRHIQLSIALFDQYLHTSQNLESALKSFKENHKSDELIENWFCSIEHFIEYGSCYYSYILDEALSNVIWETIYQKKTFNPDAGQAMFSSLLSQSGIEPQEQINNLFRPFLLQDHQASADVDPFYLMEFWFKNFFSSSALVSIEKLRSEHRVFYK